MLNESGFIDACLDGFAAQTYAHDLMEVLVVDGGSTDGSRQRVTQRAQHEPWVRLVDNPDRIVSAAFNRGIEAATGEVLFLFSSHGVPDPAYVEQSVKVLQDTGAAGVGGRYQHLGIDRSSQAIGMAMVSWFGMASPHRSAASRTEVDTISHPAYVRERLLEVGLFDESLTRNEDYELNYRLRAAGHRLVFDPEIGSVYRPRSGLGAAARQFYWYGRGKAAVIRRHPRSIRLRHLVPPAAVAAATVLPLAAAWPTGRRIGFAAIVGYGGLLGAAVVGARPARHGAATGIFAVTFPVIHAAWGTGFLVTIVRGDPTRPMSH
jgi:GT2 family glycosyltransferase